ncbi:hypothetical protein ACNOYE_22230 [Nannocystaceae bacterium ST9]
MAPARITLAALAVLLALGCSRRPSAELDLDGPDPASVPAERVDARIAGLCEHSFAVLAGESLSLRSPGVEDDFIARCIAGNQTKRSELGEQAWAARSSCIERAASGVELGRCDGREPRPEPAPILAANTTEGRVLCEHIFDVMIAELPDMKTMLGPDQLGPIMAECIEDADLKRIEDPIAYDRMARCMMATTKMADFEACENP